MKIYPSIDIKDGRCVRLLQGRFDASTIYSLSPAERARQFDEAGAQQLHVVDLDGAQHGKIAQRDTIREIIAAFPGQIQVGGGIRQRQDVLDLLEAGVHRVVLGTVAIRTPDLVATWAQEFGWHRFVMALDFRLVNESPLLATSGWQQSTELSLWSWLDQMLSRGSFGVLCTDIGKDGMQEGPNFSFYEQITARYPQLEVQASGGVGSVSDLSKLKKGGLQGAIIGKAIYEGKISLAEALQC